MNDANQIQLKLLARLDSWLAFAARAPGDAYVQVGMCLANLYALILSARYEALKTLDDERREQDAEIAHFRNVVAAARDGDLGAIDECLPAMFPAEMERVPERWTALVGEAFAYWLRVELCAPAPRRSDRAFDA